MTDAALCARFSDKFCVLFAGNISPAQNLDLLVECAVRLRDAGRSDIHFIIVGDGMSRVSLEERVEKEGVSSLFSFEGQKPAADIPRYTGLQARCLRRSMPATIWALPFPRKSPVI